MNWVAGALADFWQDKAKEEITGARWRGDLDIANDQHCSITRERVEVYNRKYKFDER